MHSGSLPRRLGWTRFSQAMTLGILAVLLVVGVAMAGCTSGSAPQAHSDLEASIPLSGLTGTVAMNHDLAATGAQVAKMVFTGFDDSGAPIHGPTTLASSARHVLLGVPIEVETFTVEYRTAGDRLVSLATVRVAVTTGVAVEATPTPATGSTLLQAQNATSTSPRMAVSAYVAPANLDNLEVFDLASGGPVTMTPMPDGSNWRYVDMGPNDQYLLYSIEPNSSGVVDNQLNSFIVAFGDSSVFTTQPYCPGTFGLYPNGMNYFECALNVTTGETLDISCNQGANSYLAVQCSPTPSASPTAVPGWTTNNGTVSVTSFQNSFLSVSGSYDDNCCLVGVYPYGLSNCTATPSNCLGSTPPGPFCSNAAAHCQVQRNPGQQGGVVLVQFTGLMSPSPTPSPMCSPTTP